jgi:hypothetical protein
VEVLAGQYVLEANNIAMLNRLPGPEVLWLPIRTFDPPQVILVRASEARDLLLPGRPRVTVGKAMGVKAATRYGVTQLERGLVAHLRR